MNEQPDTIVTDKAKSTKQVSLGKFLRERAQIFLSNNQSKSVVIMSDREYQKLPSGWALQRQ